MPNGGSDCCGTCWFNRANRGKAGSANHDSSVRSCCEIRAVAIENPFYTYCANHPHRRPDRDPIPIGPILRPGEVGPTSPEIGPTLLDSRPRVVWKPSPDTEEVRRHLLRLLSGLRRHAAKDRHFPTPGLAVTVLWQLGEFAEARAIPDLERIANRGGEEPEFLVPLARKALSRIRARTKDRA